MRLGHLIETLLCLLLCLLLCGCFPVVPYTIREIHWQGASATTCLEQHADLKVWVNPAELKEELQIRMPDGKILSTSALNLETIWPYTVEARMHPKGRKEEPGWTSYSILFENGFWASAGGYSFSFKNGSLVGFSATGNSSAPENLRPAIGKAGGSVMYAFPLTEANLTELLGPWQSKRDTRSTLIGSTSTNYPVKPASWD